MDKRARYDELLFTWTLEIELLAPGERLGQLFAARLHELDTDSMRSLEELVETLRGMKARQS